MFCHGRFRFQNWKKDAAAAEGSLSNRVNCITAYWAYIKTASPHIGGSIAVDHELTGKQFGNRDLQRLGQRFDQADIGQAPSGFPFGNRLIADHNEIRKLFLRKSPLFPEFTNGICRYIAVHCVPVLSGRYENDITPIEN
jgi:hypothetical protein